MVGFGQYAWKHCAKTFVCVVSIHMENQPGQEQVLALSQMAVNAEDEQPHITRCRNWQQQQADKCILDSVSPSNESLFVHIFNLNSDGTARGRPPSASEITSSQILMRDGWSIGEAMFCFRHFMCVCL